MTHDLGEWTDDHMGNKERLIVGIDIGSHAVKMCQLQKLTDAYKLVAVGSATIPPGAVEDGVLQKPDEVGEIISNLAKNLKIKNKKVGISISGYSVIVKKLSLESMDEDDLSEYINREAEQYIPFDAKDVYIDFKKIYKNNPSKDRVDVMLVAAKKEIVDSYITMLRSINFNTVLVDVDGFALENIWETFTQGIQNVVLVDVGASKMNINIISDGVSVLARDIVVGSEQLTEQIATQLDIEYEEAEKIKLGSIDSGDTSEKISYIYNQTCTQWILEIKKAIDLYSANNPDKPLQQLVLSGGGSKVNGLKEYVEKEIKLNVVTFNPFEKMVIDHDKFDELYLRSISSEMAIAAGLAIRKIPF